MYILSFVPSKDRVGFQSAGHPVVLGLPHSFSHHCILSALSSSYPQEIFRELRKLTTLHPSQNQSVSASTTVLRPGGSSAWIRHCGFDPISGPYLVSLSIVRNMYFDSRVSELAEISTVLLYMGPRIRTRAQFGCGGSSEGDKVRSQPGLGTREMLKRSLMSSPLVGPWMVLAVNRLLLLFGP